MRIIMYHYVRAFNKCQPYLHFLDVEDFAKQLEFFKREFGLVSRQEFCDVLAKKITVEELKGKVLLTFDDALSCHYQYAFKTLQEHGLFGVFFVSTKPLVEFDLLDVHKIHYLTSKLPSDEIIDLVELAKEWAHFDKSTWEKHSQNVYRMQENLNGVHELKFVLNYCSPSGLRGDLLDYLANKIGVKWNASDFYLSKQQLIEMQDEGMIFGSHTHSHPMMSTLSFDQQITEIKKSKDILGEILGIKVELYCHTYGGKLSYNVDTSEALKQNGIKFAFDVNAREVTNEDLEENELFIPRFDCNMFPHGKSFLSR